MHFLGIEIGHGGTRAVVLNLESAGRRGFRRPGSKACRKATASKNPVQWIDEVDRAVQQLLAEVFGAPVVPVSSRQGAVGFEEIASYLVAGDSESRCDPDPQAHEMYQELMSRQQYLVDTLHPSGFL